MNTVQWLKIEKSNFKFLNKSIKKKLNLFRKTNFLVFKKIEIEINSIEKNIKNIEANLTKQKKLARRIKKRPKLKIFEAYDNKETKRPPFLGKGKETGLKNSKSKTVLKILESLAKNSSLIIVNQASYNSSLNNLIKFFKKEKYDLVFIRKEIDEYKYTIKELTIQRKQQNILLEKLIFKLNDALLVSKKASHTLNLLDINQNIQNYNNKMDKFEYFVNNLVDIGGKECRGLVYLKKIGHKKEYQKKYEMGLIDYKTTLSEIPKLISSI
ncbi:hypothetical protein N9E35_02660 [Candidatus Marinimicrobia bacterium]|nr:hypothetical protein [Candidatus Neomarinimicrobiota bacterium]